MKILILDALTQTVYLNRIYTSGVIRAAENDVKAFVAAGYDVTYAFYGKPDNTRDFKTVSFGDEGLKDRTTFKKHSGMLLNKEKGMIIDKLKTLDFDYMLIHLHSFSSYIVDLCKEFINIPKIFVVHDYITDVYVATNMLVKLYKIKAYPNTIVLSNSPFTQRLGNDIYRERFDIIKDLNQAKINKPTIVGLDINNESNFVDRAHTHFVWTNQKEPVAYENGGYSINIGRFEPNKRTLRMFCLHRYAKQHHARIYGVQDPYHEASTYFNKVLKYCTDYEQYTLCEDFSDTDLLNSAKFGDNLIVSYEREGFGYTPFEMGLMGIPSIVIVDVKWGYRHATAHYLKLVGVPFKKVKAGKPQELAETMSTFNFSRMDKLNISEQFIKYFTLENYIQDRLNAWESAKQRVPLSE